MQKNPFAQQDPSSPGHDSNTYRLHFSQLNELVPTHGPRPANFRQKLVSGKLESVVKELFNFAPLSGKILIFYRSLLSEKVKGLPTMDVKERGGGKYSCRSQECQDLPCKLCQDQTFKRTSRELQNLPHTNKLMGNDRDTIFAMVLYSFEHKRTNSLNRSLV
jgi:hypothetical protein